MTRTIQRASTLVAFVLGCGQPAAPAKPAPEPLPAGAEHHHPAAMVHRFDNAETWAKVFDDPARDAWQHPDDVVAALGLTASMTVADVGAGTGYFTVRLARAVPSGQVIATDIEPDMVRYLTERATREGLPNVRAVLSTGDDPRLAPGSVDRVLVVVSGTTSAIVRATRRGSLPPCAPVARSRSSTSPARPPTVLRASIACRPRPSSPT